MLPPPELLPVLQKLKQAYLAWFEYYPSIPKIHRHTLASRIDALLIEAVEMTTTAKFTPKTDKLPYVRVAIRKLDTVKLLLMILWETKSLDNKKYIALSQKLSLVGQDLGAWHVSLLPKQNSPDNIPGEK